MKRLWSVDLVSEASVPERNVLLCPASVTLSWTPGKGSEIAVAVSGSSVARVLGLDGTEIATLDLQSEITALAWKNTESALFIATSNSSTLAFWLRRDDSKNHKELETNCSLRGFSCLSWSNKDEVLAAGTTKGAILLFTQSTLRGVPVLGSHSQAITKVCWTFGDLLVAVSEDPCFSVCTKDGDTVFRSAALPGIPNSVCLFSDISFTRTSTLLHGAIGMITNDDSVFIHSLEPSEMQKKLNSIVITPSSRSQPIISVAPVNEATMALIEKSDSNKVTEPGVMVVSRTGQVSVTGIVTKTEYISQRIFKAGNSSFAWSPKATAFSCDYNIKVIDASNLRDVVARVAIEPRSEANLKGLSSRKSGVVSMAWSCDSKTLCVFAEGKVHAFLRPGPILRATCNRIVAVSNGFSEVNVIAPNKPLQLVSMAPSNAGAVESSTQLKSIEYFGLAVSETYVVAVSASHLHVHNLKSINPKHQLLNAFCYPISINLSSNPCTSVCIINNTVFILANPQSTPLVCFIPKNEHNEFASKAFGDKAFDMKTANSLDLVAFLSCTQTGLLCLLLVDHDATVIQRIVLDELTFKESAEFPKLWHSPNFAVAVIDNFRSSFITEYAVSIAKTNLENKITLDCTQWNLANCVQLSDSAKPKKYAFDLTFSNLVYEISEKYTIKTFSFVSTVALSDTPVTRLLGETCVASQPEIFDRGIGSSFNVEEADYETKFNAVDLADPLVLIHVDPGNKNFEDSVSFSNKNEGELIQEALRLLKLDCAARISNHNKKGCMRSAYLRDLSKVDTEIQCLRGHVHAWNGMVKEAQECFLKSRTVPQLCIRSQCDLMQFDSALQYVQENKEQCEPDLEFVLCFAHAMHLESAKKYQDALAYYKKAKSMWANSNSANSWVAKKAWYGEIRVSLLMGNFSMASKAEATKSRSLMRQCAEILQSLREWELAGRLYSKSKEHNKSVECFLYAQSKQTSGKIKEQLHYVTDLRLLKKCGEYFEAQVNTNSSELELIQDCIKCYVNANEFEKAVTLLLKTNKIEEAIQIARETKNTEAAKLVVEFLSKQGATESVLEFFVIAGLRAKACEHARQNKLEIKLIKALGSEVTLDELRMAASWLASREEYLEAGKLYADANEYEKAFRLFLKAASQAKTPGSCDEALESAVIVVGKSGNLMLTAELATYMMSMSSQGKLMTPAASRHVIRLYVAVGEYAEAASAALSIARDEMDTGGYKHARDDLLDIFRVLRDAQKMIPGQLMQMLVQVHSYMLAKTLLVLEDHVAVARLLVRVARNLSFFAQHAVVPILTTAVLECSKAKMHKVAFEFATVLMQPENRVQVDQRFRKRVEVVVRNGAQASDDASASEMGDLTGCPYCEAKFHSMLLECPSCLRVVPFCIASGQHITATEQWTQCANCKLPALLAHFQKLAENDIPCPMCDAKIAEPLLPLSADQVQTELTRWQQMQSNKLN